MGHVVTLPRDHDLRMRLPAAERVKRSFDNAPSAASSGRMRLHPLPIADLVVPVRNDFRSAFYAQG